MNDEVPTVYIVDDDSAVRDALRLLMKSVGLACETFASAPDFLARYDERCYGCLIADVRMPQISGLELQKILNERGASLPIIFVTGHGDVPKAVDAMQGGALDFIQKPFGDEELLARVEAALKLAEEQRATALESARIRKCIDSLTPREREVMDKVVTGRSNKVIAFDLGVSQRTVELHRARVMQKMGTRSLAELVHMIDKLAGATSA